MARALFLTLLPALLFAQIKSGTIVGRVTDSSGAVVASADVTVAHPDTGRKTRLSTNSSGDYIAPYLLPGVYDVEAAAPGFARSTTRGVIVTAAEIARVDVTLQVARVETATEVQATADPLQTDSASVQSSADAAAIAAIPNVNRNPLYFTVLQEGVVPRRAMLDTTGPNAFGVGYQARRQFTAFSINGGSSFNNEILLDGVSILGSAWNEATVLPNLNGLGDVRVIQNTYPAEYGRGQGVVSMFTRSGANQFHGDPHFEWRNNPHPQPTFADAMRNIWPGPVKVLNFGLNLGGPIVRNKVFFFAAWERIGNQDSPQWLLRVPTALERQGNFSRTFIAGDDGQPIPAAIFDPYSATLAGENLYRRAPFPNATVPSLSPYARAILALYPDPNRTPDDAFQNGNYFATHPRNIDRNSVNLRLDGLRARHAWYASGGLTRGNLRTARPFGADSPVWIAPTHNGTSSERVRDRNWYAILGDTLVFSPRLMADVRVGVTRVDSDAGSGAGAAFDYDAVGMPRNVQSLIFTPGHAPDILAGTFSGPIRSTYDNKEERQLNWQSAGSVTRLAGAWTVKLGGEFRNQLANNTDPMTATAVLESPNSSTRTFAAEYVTADGRLSALNTSPQQRGLAVAGLLSGAAYWSNPGALRMALSHKYAALYTQTQWRASANLTVTLGLRWDWQPAPTERYGRIAAIDFGRNQLAFGGRLWDTEWSDWQPRIGFAWRAASSLVIRGGYGLTYLPTNVGYYTSDQSFGSVSFAPRVDPRPFGADPQGVPAGRFWDPGLHVLAAATPPDPALPPLYGSGTSYYFDRHDTRNGRVHQANLFVERRIANRWVVAAGYVGAVWQRLQNARWPIGSDQLLPIETLQAWRAEYIRTAGAHNPGNDLVPNPLQPASGDLLPYAGALGNRTIPRRLTLYRYPLFADASLQATNGSSDYHSLQVRVSRSFARGLMVRAHYTRSKATDFSNTPLQWGQGFDDTRGASNGPDVRNAANNRKLSYTDQPHRAVVMATWDSPWRSEGLRLKPRLLLADWRVSGILLLQSGSPIGIGGLDSGSLTGRQNRIPGVPIEAPADLQRWYDGATTVTLPSGRRITPCANCFLKFNSDAFGAPYLTNSDGSIVNDLYWTPTAAINYGDMRGDGRANLDLRVTRQFRLRRRVALEIVASLTNALDTRELQGNYDGALGSLVTQNAPARGLLPGYGSSSNFGTQYPVAYDRRQFLIGMGMHF